VGSSGGAYGGRGGRGPGQARLVAGDGQDDAFAARHQGRDLASRGWAPVPLFPRHRAGSLCRHGVEAVRRTAVRRPSIARLAEEDALDAKDIAEIEALLKELKS